MLPPKPQAMALKESLEENENGNINVGAILEDKALSRIWGWEVRGQWLGDAVGEVAGGKARIS